MALGKLLDRVVLVIINHKGGHRSFGNPDPRRTPRLHYAYTLHHWYRRVTERRAQIEALYDERFFRM